MTWCKTVVVLATKQVITKDSSSRRLVLLLDSCARESIKATIRRELGIKNGWGSVLEEFRAQLITVEQRLLYDAWLAAGAGRRLPSRRALQMRAIGALLPVLSVVAREACGSNTCGVRIRMAGSGLKEVLCADPYTALLQATLPGGLTEIEEVLQSGKPQAGVSVLTDGTNQVLRHWMRLPLGDDNGVDEVIGLDCRAPGAVGSTGVPVWMVGSARSVGV